MPKGSGKPGSVKLVGAGPGDPGLITLKGIEAIAEAHVILYDFLASEKLLTYAGEGVKTIYVGKKGPGHSLSQAKITRLIIDHARAGKRVVRLKGGDPFIFGRGGEEALGLKRAGIPFEIIPGVTSAVSAPAYAGIPLTHRDFASTVTFITGQEGKGKRTTIQWSKLPVGKGTLVFMMGWKRLPYIMRKLKEIGWSVDTPVAVIRWGAMTRQQTVTGSIGSVARLVKEAGLKPPVVIVVGGVVSLRGDLNWFETKPLFGKRVLVTRAGNQAGTFTSLLERSGADGVTFPMIKTVEPPSWAPLDKSIKRLTKGASPYDWLILTSVNGVDFFFKRLFDLGFDLRALKGVKIAAVGSKTAEAVEKRGITVDLVPDEFKAEGLLKALGGRGGGGKKGEELPLSEGPRCP